MKHVWHKITSGKDKQKQFCDFKNLVRCIIENRVELWDQLWCKFTAK